MKGMKSTEVIETSLRIIQQHNQKKNIVDIPTAFVEFNKNLCNKCCIYNRGNQKCRNDTACINCSKKKGEKENDFEN